jgi:hypothetical protein
MAYASDFCGLLSQALAGDVFHSPLLVTLGQIWHYTGAAVSCRLRYRAHHDRLTVHNSAETCDWLNQHAANWNPSTPTS